MTSWSLKCSSTLSILTLSSPSTTTLSSGIIVNIQSMGCGVLIYVRSCNSASVLFSSSRPFSSILNILPFYFCDSTSCNGFVLYRRPYAPDYTFFFNWVAQHLPTYPLYLVAGDFNVAINRQSTEPDLLILLRLCTCTWCLHPQLTMFHSLIACLTTT